MSSYVSLPLVPAPGTHENRRYRTILAALLRLAIFVGTRIAGTQGDTDGLTSLDPRFRGAGERMACVQNFTRSAPLRPRITRASFGVAT
jgi:hypothetical protein